MKYFDSHAHYYGDRYELPIKDYLKEHPDLYVCQIGYDKETNDLVRKDAKENERVLCANGVHPGDAHTIDLSYIEELRKNKDEYHALKTGMDYHYSKEHDKIQQEWFHAILKLATELNKPVVIHSRDADQITYEILKQYKVKSVMHCYGYSTTELQKYVDLNCFISIGGIVTFKNAKVNQEVAINTPLENLFVETDCPWLAPTPFRGKTNFPHYVEEVIKKVAELKNQKVEDIRKITFENIINFYKN